MDGRIYQLKEELAKNLQRHWIIQEMAEFCGLSVSHFQKQFKADAKKPPLTYLRDLRLEKARELLETTFKNISEIRYEVGIYQDSHFTRDFKKKFGASPLKYRKQYWDKIYAERLIAKK